eukprot:914026-Lingulodinium_polyedra.AAC.1
MPREPACLRGRQGRRTLQLAQGVPEAPEAPGLGSHPATSTVPQSADQVGARPGCLLLVHHEPGVLQLRLEGRQQQGRRLLRAAHDVPVVD